MDKRSKIILGVFAVVLLSIIVTEVTRPKPLNWGPSYTAADKIPFGCYVLYNELSTLFSERKITKVEETVYDVLSNRDTTETSNYFFVNDHIDLDQQETNQLLDYVAQGNSVFIAASSFSYNLKDTLNIEIDYEYTLQEDTISIDLNGNGILERVYFDKKDCPKLIIEEKGQNQMKVEN